MSELVFTNLDDVTNHLRNILINGITRARKPTRVVNQVLIFAYNGTGKTRLSMSFKDEGKKEGGRDTLYFNAFTEDLFVWNNDLPNDKERSLLLNKDSQFFIGLDGLDIENKIRPILHQYCDFDFTIDYSNWSVTFNRTIQTETGKIEIPSIKVSRGEENTFIWCFFLAIAQIASDAKEDGDPYFWVKFIYVDDPISSLDDNNAIAIASNLAQLIKKQDRIKFVISSHHSLFFNIMCNELDKSKRYVLNREANSYVLEEIEGDTARFYHVTMLKELKQVALSGDIYLYHFNILRILLEKTAAFHGFKDFADCIKSGEDTNSIAKHLVRLIQAKNHGNYSLFEPEQMTKEDKKSFRKILKSFETHYRFNPELISTPAAETTP